MILPSTLSSRASIWIRSLVVQILLIDLLVIGTVSMNERPGVSSVLVKEHLQILPKGPQEKSVGKNLFLTCQANVPNMELIRNLEWHGPQGQLIPQDDRVYTEELPGQVSVALFIKGLTERDSGLYVCSAIYANNKKLVANVTIVTYIGITWEDAPFEQYGVINKDFKIRCVVRANPPASVDWLKENLILSTGDRYVIDTDGLLIRNLQTEDAGTYTCRARVAEKGALEERDIKLVVQIPPTWDIRPVPVKGIEHEKVEFVCKALGTPNPFYQWVDSKGNDVTQKESWTLEANTGRLTAYYLKREDSGSYKCIAKNSAGIIESTANLSVIIKPKVQELYNKTFSVGASNGQITCKASGDPLPNVTWRKWSRSKQYIEGGQPDDDRIVVRNKIERAPDYTEGEQEWKVSVLTISSIKREDDGLYECEAANEGGKFFKSGHIQVEFGPTFEEQPMAEQWSWNSNKVNLTCIATSIPNATITWWYQDNEIDRDIIDRNYRIYGKGPRSDLIVRPIEAKYYGRYMCKAVNPLGEAEHEIYLREATEPAMLEKTIIDKITATTIQFRFIEPKNTGGLNIDAYAVEYKEASLEWYDARRRLWPANSMGLYVLENLLPQVTYDFRFGCKNLVGFSEWSRGQQLIMPQRGPPEPPRINIQGHRLVNDVLQLDAPNSYELFWFLPEDNGEPIDFFEISFFPTKRQASMSKKWQKIGDLMRTEVPHPGSVRYVLHNLYPNTYYVVEIRSHNNLGFSAVSSVIIKTSQGTPGVEYSTVRSTIFQSESLSIGAVIGIACFVLAIGVIVIDVTCYKVNKFGFTNFLCGKSHNAVRIDGTQNDGGKGHTNSSANPMRSENSTNWQNGRQEFDPLMDTVKVDGASRSSSQSFVTKGKNGAASVTTNLPPVPARRRGDSAV